MTKFKLLSEPEPEPEGIDEGFDAVGVGVGAPDTPDPDADPEPDAGGGQTAQPDADPEPDGIDNGFEAVGVGVGAPDPDADPEPPDDLLTEPDDPRRNAGDDGAADQDQDDDPPARLLDLQDLADPAGPSRVNMELVRDGKRLRVVSAQGVDDVDAGDPGSRMAPPPPDVARLDPPPAGQADAGPVEGDQGAAEAADPDPAAEFLADRDGDGYPEWFGTGANGPPDPVADVMAWAYGEAAEPEPARVRRQPPPPSTDRGDDGDRPGPALAPGQYGRRRDKVSQKAPRQTPPPPPKPPPPPRGRQHTYASVRSAHRRSGR